MRKAAIGNRILLVLTHPVFTSLLATALIVLLFIPTPHKYKLQQKDYLISSTSRLICYDDLDGNGYSDRILASDYAGSNGVASVLVRCHPFISFNEWDVQGKFPPNSALFLTTGDFDNNGLKEVYFFSCRNDSLFLNVIFSPDSKYSPTRERFIVLLKTWNGKPHFNIYLPTVVDMNRDSYGDLVFAVNGGFPVEPRLVFIYDIRNDSLVGSPPKGFMTNILQIRDINRDSYPEIIMTGYASQNMADTNSLPLHDNCCWLIVYDHRLNYLFPPKQFRDIGYSGITNALITGKDGKTDLFSCYTPPESSKDPAVLYRINCQGEILDSVNLNLRSYASGGSIFAFRKGKDFLLGLPISDEEIWCFDTSLNLVEKKQFRPGMTFITDSIDIDDDGANEMICISGDRSLLSIFRNDLSHPVSLVLPEKELGDEKLSVLKSPEKPPELILFSKEQEIHLLYSVNNGYYYQWGIYGSIFISILLFTFLIKRIQLSQFQKRIRIEKNITELQLTIIRNQMDPHFTMNAINSVIDAVNRKETGEAVQNLLHFSRMYRSLVLSSDKYKRTLKEELEFTGNYLALEKFRFREKIDYSIEVDPEVDTSLEIPKMIIQSPVENAVKHGLYNLDTGGKITIKVSIEDHVLLLSVEDNGRGRERAATELTVSTGKGMKIMDQFLDLYFRITGKRITSEVRDLYNEDRSPRGTQVLIKVPVE